ncbi:hypothetical protein PGT21_017907 [Puccinia graminis f. sp. tritici]|uniref:Uncharacterized protein n=1 Tax=Puccinia graminis f. sp. tritici TaxID=56615 RepID=A0A5B0PTP8_PUCGR|nr:hypothetical protein PGTUg99_034855 [Puccinia graminis f. sp. tritici]KAA1069267.1 hypothetical protein PGT21_019238 [Puccinia graminis f. sp. tritici]KAA1075563.1 hypothetical protein PGTUg99_025266 [Puccinia graminis f. sp. tritici]KAA1104276.1 hypothetical protein PGT21_017907 [Puccinia graminis f. sp. tritici]
MQFWFFKYSPLIFHIIEKCSLALPPSTIGKKDLSFNLNELPQEGTADALIPSTFSIPSFSASGEDLNVKKECIEPSYKPYHSPTLHNPNNSIKREQGLLDSEKRNKKSRYGAEKKLAFPKEEDMIPNDESSSKSCARPNQAQVQNIKIEPQDPSSDISNLQENINNEPERNQKKDQILNVSDWNYVKIDPQHEILNVDGGLEPVVNLFEFLRKMKDEEDSGKVFCISRDKDVIFFLRYVSTPKKDRFAYPDFISESKRSSEILRILFEISERKLSLENYFCFFTDIRDKMILRFEPSLQSETRKVKAYKLNQVQSRIKYLKDITKISIILIILYLSLFGEHEADELKKQDLMNLVDFFEDFWKKCSVVEHHETNYEESVENLFHDLVNLKENESFHSSLRNSYFKYFTMPWKMVKYWIEKTGRGQIKNVVESGKYYKIIKSIINQIVFHSNYNNILNRINSGKFSSKGVALDELEPSFH